MAIADLIPTLDDKALANLQSNAMRLGTSGSSRQQTDAAVLLPLIEAEFAERLARKPVKAKAVRAKKKVAPVE